MRRAHPSSGVTASIVLFAAMKVVMVLNKINRAPTNAIVYWSIAIGFWPTAIGYWPTVIGLTHFMLLNFDIVRNPNFGNTEE